MTTQFKHAAQPRRTERILKFDGGCNFRDLGGYATRDGRSVAWGKIYRTGVLSYFSENDQPALRELGVTAICDLRRAVERGREPTRWPDADVVHLNFEDGAAPPTVQTVAARYPSTPDGMRSTMIDVYRALPGWMRPRLRGMFERLAADGGPMIVHCAAGKDRTGVAIALLLTALEIPHETIVEDYLLTNEAGDFERFIVSKHNSQLGVATSTQPLFALAEDVRRVLFAADADYLAAAFEQIAHDHGNVETYLKKEIGVDDTMRGKLQAMLLQAPESRL